jgi:hypothetical protein
MLCFVAQLSVLFGTHLTGARHGRIGAYQLAAQPSGVGMTDFDHDGSTDQQDWSPSVSLSTCPTYGYPTPGESASGVGKSTTAASSAARPVTQLSDPKFHRHPITPDRVRSRPPTVPPPCWRRHQRCNVIWTRAGTTHHSSTPAESTAQTQALSPYAACCRGTGEIRCIHFCISPVNSITCTRPNTALSFFALI